MGAPYIYDISRLRVKECNFNSFDFFFFSVLWWTSCLDKPQ